MLQSTSFLLAALMLMPKIVVVAAKSTSDASTVSPYPPDPNSQQSTISTVEREIRESGGEAVAIPVDVRSFESVKELVDQAARVRSHGFMYLSNINAV